MSLEKLADRLEQGQRFATQCGDGDHDDRSDPSNQDGVFGAGGTSIRAHVHENEPKGR